VPLYEVTDEGLSIRPEAAFAALGMYERVDLQRLLLNDISALGEDLLVIAEEFSQWEDARRRIDLLAIDQTGRLVVIELKRAEAGGHMDLQAIRYAAMVSSMGFADVAQAYAAHCRKHRTEEVDSQAELEAFLEVGDTPEESIISSDVRIMLVSADFDREITTTVLWLNRFGMDIRCVRLVPYDVDGKILLHIQQVLPLPEAADYQVRLRQKEVARDRARDTRDFTRYHIVVEGEALPDQNKRNSVRVMIEQLVARGVPLAAIKEVLPPARMIVLPGRLRDQEAVEAAFVAAYPPDRLRRWFSEFPFVDEDEGRTYLLTKMWGRNTQRFLTDLANAFPDAKVGFRPADAVEE
jgi:hypothetical protein